MKILSLASVFPNPGEPGLGLFVRSRIQHMAATAEVKVLAPVPIIDYSHPQGRWWRGWRVPAARHDGEIEVLHPGWIYPPGGTPLNIVCLFLRLFFTVYYLRQRYRFDVIDAHFGYPEGVAAALLAKVFRCPFSITVRGSETMFARQRWRRMALKWALRRADAVFAVSEELRDFVVDCGVPPGKASVSPNGIDAAVFRPRNRAACRAKFGMADDRRVVVCAGELIEAKGHHLVIEAVRDLVQEGIPVDLYIAGGVARGGAPFDREIRDMVARWNLDANVKLAGWLDRESLAELMAAADVFCLASFTEGWPNVVNEALACGTPAVATRVGAVPKMLIDEKYGLMVPPRQQQPLTDALRRALLTNWDRCTIARWGQARSWEEVGKEVVEVMKSLLPSSPPRTTPDRRRDSVMESGI